MTARTVSRSRWIDQSSPAAGIAATGGDVSPGSEPNSRKERNPAGHETTFTLQNAHDSVVRVVDPNGEVSDFSYDGFGRPAVTRDTAGILKSLTFIDSRRVDRAYAIRTSVAGRPDEITDFDRLGRMRESLTANFNGDVVEQSQSYDALDRVARMDRVDAATLSSEAWTTVYGTGLETTPGVYGVSRAVTDPNRHRTVTFLDGAGAVEHVVDALQGTTEYQYGPYGFAKSVVRPDLDRFDFVFDAYGRRIEATEGGPQDLYLQWVFGVADRHRRAERDDPAPLRLTFAAPREEDRRRYLDLSV